MLMQYQGLVTEIRFSLSNFTVLLCATDDVIGSTLTQCPKMFFRYNGSALLQLSSIITSCFCFSPVSNSLFAVFHFVQ